MSKQSSLTCGTELLRLGNLFLYNIHSSKNHDGVALVKQGFSLHDNNMFYFSIIPAPINILHTRGPSVIKQIGFQEFLNQKKKNRKKPEKKTEQPKKPWNMVNCKAICFSGNLPAGSCQVKPR